MKYVYLTMIMVVATLLTACDAHKDFPDTAVKQCHILCSDGKVLSFDDYKTQGKKAVAVVFDVNNDENVEGYGYAVYLWDIEPVSFSDSLGTSQGTSCSLTALDGNINTFEMYNTTDVNSPLAQSVLNVWHYGQSAYIPSVAQMRRLYAVKDIINPYIEKCGGDPISDNPDACWYWTSTEVSEQETAKAWLYSLSSGAIQETPKTQAHKARPIITLNE